MWNSAMARAARSYSKNRKRFPRHSATTRSWASRSCNRSRATGALRFVNYGVRPLGALAGGALGSAFGLRPTLWFAAAAGVLGVLWLVPSPVPKLLELPEEDPA